MVLAYKDKSPHNLVAFCVFTASVSLPLGVMVAAVRGEFFLLLIGVLALTVGCIFTSSLYLEDFTLTKALYSVHVCAVIAFVLSAAIPTGDGYSWVPTGLFMAFVSEVL